MPPSSHARWSWSSTRSTSPRSRCAGTGRRWAPRSRTESAGTCTTKPAPTTPHHPPAATGIDYLHLVEQRHSSELAERLRYSELPDGHMPGQLALPGTDDRRGGLAVIEKLQSHYGFTRTPFGRSLAPQMLHRHGAHAEAVARIGWCVAERALGVITGEVGAGKTVAIRAALATLATSRHTLIYLGNPAVGGRGLYAGIVAALGGLPASTRPRSSRKPPNCSPPKTTNAAAPSCSSSTKRTYSTPTNSKNSGCSPTPSTPAPFTLRSRACPAGPAHRHTGKPTQPQRSRRSTSAESLPTITTTAAPPCTPSSGPPVRPRSGEGRCATKTCSGCRRTRTRGHPQAAPCDRRRGTCRYPVPEIVIQLVVQQQSGTAKPSKFWRRVKARCRATRGRGSGNHVDGQAGGHDLGMDARPVERVEWAEGLPKEPGAHAASSP